MRASATCSSASEDVKRGIDSSVKIVLEAIPCHARHVRSFWDREDLEKRATDISSPKEIAQAKTQLNVVLHVLQFGAPGGHHLRKWRCQTDRLRAL